MPFMATKVAIERQSKQLDDSVVEEHKGVGCSIGIMAYNEDANIARTLYAVLAQDGPSIRIEDVLVVASRWPDRTVPIVTDISENEPRLQPYAQRQR